MLKVLIISGFWWNILYNIKTPSNRANLTSFLFVPFDAFSFLTALTRASSSILIKKQTSKQTNKKHGHSDIPVISII